MLQAAPTSLQPLNFFVASCCVAEVASIPDERVTVLEIAMSCFFVVELSCFSESFRRERAENRVLIHQSRGPRMRLGFRVGCLHRHPLLLFHLVPDTITDHHGNEEN